VPAGPRTYEPGAGSGARKEEDGVRPENWIRILIDELAANVGRDDKITHTTIPALSLRHLRCSTVERSRTDRDNGLATADSDDERGTDCVVSDAKCWCSSTKMGLALSTMHPWRDLRR
jgi:hypothetical protein